MASVHSTTPSRALRHGGAEALRERGQGHAGPGGGNKKKNTQKKRAFVTAMSWKTPVVSSIQTVSGALGNLTHFFR